MDNKAATYVKIPFGDKTIRSLPLEPRHIIALSMTKQLKSTSARLDVLFGILSNVLGEDGYANVAAALIGGEVTERQVMELVTALGAATRELEAARTAAREAAESNVSADE